MGLEKYLKKRHFSTTPEPAPKSHIATSDHRLAFVIQEHHASALHYDFRLELDGVLKSWAVPKGPSMDPHEHHLAVHTEDHPYEYRKFEGVIPEGNYGAGNVIIWDAGWYEPREEHGDPEKVLRKELKDGHITFILHGKKLHGEFALIKLKRDTKGDNWLLIKKGDEYASTEDITKEDTSIKSHKKVDEMNSDAPPSIADYPKIAKPWPVKPMLCTLTDEPFDDPDWLFEIKWDGYRAVGTKHKDEISLYSRNSTDFLEKFPSVAEAIRALDHDVILDGEVVVLDQHGAPHFEWLQNRKRDNQGTLYYYVFDILWMDGHDLRSMPLIERKKVLKKVIEKSEIIRFGDAIANHGKHLFHAMEQRSMEGIVAKRAKSTYREDERGSDWLKIKTHLRQEVVIGGYTEPRGGRKYLGSLLVGVYDKDGKFIYVGHSGGGIPGNQRKDLQEELSALERPDSPFTTSPKSNTPVHWVQPKLLCEMSFSEWTSEGFMRQPTFEGMRSDKSPKLVHRELIRKIGKEHMLVVDKEPTTPSGKVSLTHLDKIFFPKHKYTKGDLVTYYQSVAPFILPYLKDRPCSMNRMPDGITGERFFQKNNEHLPDWVTHADIYSDSNKKNLRWVVGDSLDTLLYMVQLGCIEINPWNSRVGSLDKPDWMVIDLDPEGVTFEDVITVAKRVKEVCDEWHIPTVPKTSGKTGIHIFVPLQAKYSHEQAKNLAHLIVIEVNKREPKLTSIERMPEKRPNRIYLDFLQNREGQTLAAPYSVRPTPDASVSMPLHWDEVKKSLSPSDFTIHNALRRLQRTGDLWKPIIGKGIDVEKILKAME